jgi:hypothetical protein
MNDNPTAPSASAVDEKPLYAEQVERIASHDRVPGHENYHEKNGLRTYGDGEDHDHEPPVSSTTAILSTVTYTFAAVLQKIYVFDGNGFSLDWIADSCLYIWSVNFPTYSSQLAHHLIPGGIPPYIYADIGGVDRYVPFL